MLDFLFAGLWNTPTAKVFTVFISVFAAFSVLMMIFNKKKSSFITEHAPSILTTIGIFGTFFGIAVGLGSFDVKNIEGSIPDLLEGMKLAFWTSILGMFFALVIKLLEFLGSTLKNVPTDGPIGATADDIYRVLSEQKSVMEALRTSIGGDTDSSLITQIKLLKSDFQENAKSQREQSKNEHTELVQEFQNFAKTMAENNSSALIDALNGIIRDFNEKISEQFGDNFKRLNSAVEQLLIWQDNYKEQVEKMISQLELATVGIDNSQKAIAKIRDDADSIPATMDKLRGLLLGLDDQINNSSELLRGFVALRKQADEVFPTIKQGVDSITSAMEETAENVKKAMFEHDSFLRNSIDAIGSVFKTTLEDVKQSTKDNFGLFNKEMEDELTKAINALGSRATALVGDIAKESNAAVVAMDKAREILENAARQGDK